MLQLILDWYLDLIAFAILIFSFMLVIDHRYISLHFDRRRRGAMRASCTIMVLGCAYLALDRGEVEREQLRRAIDGFATTYADEFREHGHSAISHETSSEDPRYLLLIEKQRLWLKLTSAVHDIYSMRRGADGRIRLLVDSETDYNRTGESMV